MIHKIRRHFNNRNILAVLFVEEVSRFTAYNAAADNYDILCVLNKLGVFKDCNCLSGFGVFIAGKLEEDIFCSCFYRNFRR